MLGAVAAMVLLTSAVALPAQAHEAKVTEAEIWFVHSSSAGWGDIVDAMEQANGSVATRDFLEAARQDPNLADTVPALKGAADSTQLTLLTAAISQLGSGPDVAAAQPGDVITIGAGAAPASVSSAPVAGYFINHGYSWYFKDRINYTVCVGLSCSVKSWFEFRYTSDPGLSGSKTSVHFLEFSSASQYNLGNPSLNSRVLVGSTAYSNVTNIWSSPGSGVQWNSPHSSSTSGKSIFMYYKTSMGLPNGTTAVHEYKTATAACTASSNDCRWT